MNKWTDTGFTDIAEARKISKKFDGDPTMIRVKGKYFYYETSEFLVAQSAKGGPVKQRARTKRQSQKLLASQQQPINRPWLASKWGDVDPSRTLKEIKAECIEHGVLIGQGEVLYMRGIDGLVAEYRDVGGKVQFRTMNPASSHLTGK